MTSSYEELEIPFNKCLVRAFLFNILDDDDLNYLAQEFCINISDPTEDLRIALYLHTSDVELSRKIELLINSKYAHKIGVSNMREFIDVVSIYPPIDLAKLYLHMNLDEKQSGIVWKYINKSYDKPLSKCDIVELILTQLFSLPKDRALTAIKNDIKMKLMYHYA